MARTPLAAFFNIPFQHSFAPRVLFRKERWAEVRVKGVLDRSRTIPFASPQVLPFCEKGGNNKSPIAATLPIYIMIIGSILSYSHFK